MSLSQTADETRVGYDTVIAERIAFIDRELAEIKSTLEFIRETMVSADDTIKKVAAEVMPTLNQVMQSPMLRMLTGGKK